MEAVPDEGDTVAPLVGRKRSGRPPKQGRVPGRKRKQGARAGDGVGDRAAASAKSGKKRGPKGPRDDSKRIPSQGEVEAKRGRLTALV